MIIDYPKKYIDILGTYLIKDIDDFHITNIEQKLKSNTAQEIINHYINLMDCSRYDSEHNFRLMQTVGIPYQILVTQIVYFVITYINTDEVFNIIKTRHENNIRFELENPPIVYNDKKTTKIKTVKNKRTRKTETKPKQTKEEKKTAKINAKFATFNIPKIKL